MISAAHRRRLRRTSVATSLALLGAAIPAVMSVQPAAAAVDYTNTGAYSVSYQWDAIDGGVRVFNSPNAQMTYAVTGSTSSIRQGRYISFSFTSEAISTGANRPHSPWTSLRIVQRPI